jgi:Tfp pilus assembly protein PilN
MTTLLDRSFLGIEFRDDSVVFAFLKNSVSGIELVSSAVFQLKESEDNINEIRDFINRQGVDINSVYVSVPDKWAITKFTEIPSIKGKGKNVISNMMKFELERHIPFPVENVAFDFLILQKKAGTCSVVFLAIQNEKVETVRGFLEKIALNPHLITTSSFAVLNSIELSGVPVGGLQEVIGITRRSDIFGKKDEIAASLYIGGVNVGLMIVREGLCTHLRTFVLGPAEEADVPVKKIVQFLSEVREKLSVEKFDKLLISGDISPFKDITGRLKEQLASDNVLVSEVSEFKGSIQGKGMNGFVSAVGACFAGIGIGTHRINVLPHKREYEIKKVAPLATKVFLVLVLVMLIGIFIVGSIKQKNYLTGLEASLMENKPAIIEIEKTMSNIDQLKKRGRVLYDVKSSEIALEVLAELSSILPSDAWVTNLHYKGFDITEKKNGGELLISGFASSSSILIPLLEDSAYLEKVEFVGPIKKRGDKEQFKLKAELVKPTDRENK